MSLPARGPRWPLVVAIVLAAPAAAALLTAVVALAVLGPLPADPHARVAQDGLRIVDRNGRVLYAPADDGVRHAVPLSEISPSLRAAVIATEDSAFYRHPGVDPLAVARATLDGLRAGRPVSGAGTITQQLVRNLFLTPGGDTGAASQSGGTRPSRLARKVQETVLALRLSHRLDKDQVLELYLNHAYFGNLAYGAEAAAQTYFGRPARDLDLAEAALLAGLIQAPATYDPLRHPDAARARQSRVLDLMVHSGAITTDQAEAARGERPAFAPARFPIAAPHFVVWVREQVETALGPRAAHGGLRIVTTLDLGTQRVAEDAVRRQLASLTDKQVSNAAVVALDPQTGDVLAMVGSADYFDASIDGSVNLALAPRQPGSALKPLLYALALEGDITPATSLPDVPTAFTTRAGELYSPNNYDGRFHGLIPAREALAGSYNVPAVRLLSQIGTNRFLAIAAAAGITTLSESDRLDLSVILGGGETPLLELTGAYATLAAGGVRHPPRAILRVEDSAGRVVWQPPAAPTQPVFSPEAAWLVTDILADNDARAPSFGTNSPLRLGRPAAAKTGTTSDFRDNLTVGYTPDLVVGVWVGNADNRSMKEVSGISGAAPIWHDVMTDALNGRPARTFPRPPGVTQAEVCLPSGQKPTPSCARRRLEWFKSGTEPTTDDTYYRPLLVCGVAPPSPPILGGSESRAAPPSPVAPAPSISPQNWGAGGAPAGGAASCPSGQLIDRVFEFPPDEVIPWAREAGVNLPPIPPYRPEGRTPAGLTAAGGGATGTPSVRIVRPQPGLTARISRALPAEVQALPVEVLTSGAQPDAVRIEIDGQERITLRAPPWTWNWTLTAGVHRITAVSLRFGAEVGRHEIEVTVLAP